MKKNIGFTLIEVLIAMLVLAVGLLGLAGLQAFSLKNTQSAYTRSQATQLAYDIADKMRANPAGITTYKTANAAAQKANCLTTTGCTASDMAKNDLYEWNQAISAAIPGGTGAISAPPPGKINIVTITWDDDHDANTPDISFLTSFQL